ncbi:MAG: hypothetical protein ACKVVP_04210 [Chloroflexota bacterium]
MQNVRSIIHRLLMKLGIRHYRLFLLQQEGQILAGGIECVSGFVLDETGAVHGFWLAYDERIEQYVLQPFFAVNEPALQFANDPEYQQACLMMSIQAT